MGMPDLQLAVGLALRRIEAAHGHGQLACQRRDRERFVAVRMNELSVRSEARSGPAILLVDPTLGGVERTRRRFDRPLAERMHEPDQGTGVLDRGRLVRSTNLERSEARVWADIPPEARVVVRQAGR